MAVVFSFSGSRFFIGDPVEFSQSELVAADFSGQSWVEVLGIESIGEYGDSASYGSFIALGDRRSTRFLTHFEGSDLTLTLARNASDLGQAALLAAGNDAGTNYAIKIVYDDAPPGGTPTEDMFIALIGPLRRTGGSNTDALKWASTLGVNSNVVAVPAAGGSGTVPNNTVLPAITGTATEGQTLSLSNGTWTGSPTPQYTYQWFADGESLPGETAATLVLAAGHVGKVITGLVKATNVVGTAYAMSAATSAVSGL